MNLEHELQQALKRKSPPRGFEDRVLSRIASREKAQPPAGPTRRSSIVLPVAASLAIVAGASFYVWQQERRTQQLTEQTARDVVLALQIASEKVSAVQLKVQEISRHERQVQY